MTAAGAPVRAGSRLAEALRAVGELPVLAESRSRLLRRLRELRPAGELTAAIEADPALAIHVFRAARAAGAREIAGVPAALELVPSDALLALASEAPVIDYFDQSSAWGPSLQAARLHAVAVQRIADRAAGEGDHGHRDELLAAALLHDAGKLALAHAHAGYPARIDGAGGTPEERLGREREQLGLDHAAVGGHLARRWGLSRRVCAAIEGHHDDEPSGLAAVIGLADMLAHHAAGRAIDQRRLLRVAGSAGMTRAGLRGLLYGLPEISEGRPRGRDPSPLSRREREVLRLLAEGHRYKEISAVIGLSESTVRTHLNNIYKKLAVVDRAQAVLMARDRGWI